MDAIHLFTQKRVRSVLLFLVIISFISSSELIYHFLRHEYLNGLITFLFSLFVFLLPVFLFRKNLKLYLKLLLPIFLLVPLNIVYVVYFNSKISEATVLVLVDTNKNEALELVKSYLHVLIIFFIIYLGALYLLYRKIPNTIPAKVAGYISVCSLATLAISPLPIYLHGRAEIGYFNKIKSALFNVFPGTLAGGIINVWHQNNFIKSREKERDKFKFFSKQDPSITDKQVHILIIGESSRYDHWRINGYIKNTTPHLSKRRDIISFSNAAAGGFMTEWAVPLLLTGVGADNYNLHAKRKGIVGAFNEAGFTTYWITNQTGSLGNIKIHLSEAQKGYYLLTDFRSTTNVHLDMELVAILKNVLASPGNKKFIVIHTLGSHYDYSARYPDNFDIIKPSNKTVPSKIT
ncbi:MAG: hypothetical protein JWP78_1996, partial [Mucilaginibacter sp.]|nr:hypothetical protein [Mucilaginibacter sp.]